MNAKQNKTIAEIAQRHLCVESLVSRKRNDLDFYELAAWDIRRALVAAYEAGQAAGVNKMAEAGIAAAPTSMGDAIREHISPHTVAAIVAHLRPAYTNNETVNCELRWFLAQLVEMLGPELNPLTEELGL